MTLDPRVNTIKSDQSYLPTMTHNKIVRSEKSTSMKVSRSGEKQILRPYEVKDNVLSVNHQVIVFLVQSQAF